MEHDELLGSTTGADSDASGQHNYDNRWGTLLIELEAECCSLDSHGAFTDEHYCCPAVTRSMHSDDTHSQMWVGLGLTSKARCPIYSNLHRDPNGKNQKMSLLAAHICRGAIDR
jgi:hypothetical protein